MQEKGLSQKELSILSAISKGLSNREVSEQYHISVNTVKFHLKNSFRKLQVNNRLAAVLWYQKYLQENHQTKQQIEQS